MDAPVGVAAAIRQRLALREHTVTSSASTSAASAAAPAPAPPPHVYTSQGSSSLYLEELSRLHAHQRTLSAPARIGIEGPPPVAGREGELRHLSTASASALYAAALAEAQQRSNRAAGIAPSPAPTPLRPPSLFSTPLGAPPTPSLRAPSPLAATAAAFSSTPAASLQQPAAALRPQSSLPRHAALPDTGGEKRIAIAFAGPPALPAAPTAAASALIAARARARSRSPDAPALPSAPPALSLRSSSSSVSSAVDDSGSRMLAWRLPPSPSAALLSPLSRPGGTVAQRMRAAAALSALEANEAAAAAAATVAAAAAASDSRVGAASASAPVLKQGGTSPPRIFPSPANTSRGGSMTVQGSSSASTPPHSQNFAFEGGEAYKASHMPPSHHALAPPLVSSSPHTSPSRDDAHPSSRVSPSRGGRQQLQRRSPPAMRMLLGSGHHSSQSGRSESSGGGGSGSGGGGVAMMTTKPLLMSLQPQGPQPRLPIPPPRPTRAAPASPQDHAYQGGEEGEHLLLSVTPVPLSPSPQEPHVSGAARASTPPPPPPPRGMLRSASPSPSPPPEVRAACLPSPVTRSPPSPRVRTPPPVPTQPRRHLQQSLITVAPPPPLPPAPVVTLPIEQRAQGASVSPHPLTHSRLRGGAPSSSSLSSTDDVASSTKAALVALLRALPPELAHSNARVASALLQAPLDVFLTAAASHDETTPTPPLPSIASSSTPVMHQQAASVEVPSAQSTSQHAVPSGEATRGVGAGFGPVHGASAHSATTAPPATIAAHIDAQSSSMTITPHEVRQQQRRQRREAAATAIESSTDGASAVAAVAATSLPPAPLVVAASSSNDISSSVHKKGPVKGAWEAAGGDALWINDAGGSSAPLEGQSVSLQRRGGVLEEDAHLSMRALKGGARTTAAAPTALPFTHSLADVEGVDEEGGYSITAPPSQPLPSHKKHVSQQQRGGGGGGGGGASSSSVVTAATSASGATASRLPRVASLQRAALRRAGGSEAAPVPSSVESTPSTVRRQRPNSASRVVPSSKGKDTLAAPPPATTARSVSSSIVNARHARVAAAPPSFITIPDGDELTALPPVASLLLRLTPHLKAAASLERHEREEQQQAHAQEAMRGRLQESREKEREEMQRKAAMEMMATTAAPTATKPPLPPTPLQGQGHAGWGRFNLQQGPQLQQHVRSYLARSGGGGVGVSFTPEAWDVDVAAAGAEAELMLSLGDLVHKKAKEGGQEDTTTLLASAPGINGRSPHPTAPAASARRNKARTLPSPNALLRALSSGADGELLLEGGDDDGEEGEGAGGARATREYLEEGLDWLRKEAHKEAIGQPSGPAGASATADFAALCSLGGVPHLASGLVPPTSTATARGKTADAASAASLRSQIVAEEAAAAAERSEAAVRAAEDAATHRVHMSAAAVEARNAALSAALATATAHVSAAEGIRSVVHEELATASAPIAHLRGQGLSVLRQWDSLVTGSDAHTAASARSRVAELHNRLATVRESSTNEHAAGVESLLEAERRYGAASRAEATARASLERASQHAAYVLGELVEGVAAVSSHQDGASGRSTLLASAIACERALATQVSGLSASLALVAEGSTVAATAVRQQRKASDDAERRARKVRQREERDADAVAERVADVRAQVQALRQARARA